LDELRGHEGAAVPGAHFVDGDDVRVIEGGGGESLAAEPPRALLAVPGTALEDFHRHAAAEVLVEGEEDRAHSSQADAIDDPVAADELAGRGPLLLGGGARRRKGGGLFQEPLRARPLVRPEQPIDGAPESGVARAGRLHEGGPLRKRAFQRPLEDRVDPVHPIAVHAISTGTDACTQPTTRRWPRAAIRSR